MKFKKEIIVLLLLLITFYIGDLYRFYKGFFETENYNYSALLVYAKKNDIPDLNNMIRQTLSDNKITNKEMKKIFDHITTETSMFHGSRVDYDHSKSKQELIEQVFKQNN